MVKDHPGNNRVLSLHGVLYSNLQQMICFNIYIYHFTDNFCDTSGGALAEECELLQGEVFSKLV